MQDGRGAWAKEGVIDTSNPAHRQRLVDSFVNAVYLYDDKVVLTFNYKDGTKTITLQEVEGSDLGAGGAPKKLIFPRGR